MFKGDRKVIFWAVFLSITSIVISFGILAAILINSGEMYSISRLLSHQKEYEVTLASEDLLVCREVPETIDLNQLFALRELLKASQYERLNNILDNYQNLFIQDQTNEYFVSDAYKSFFTTYPTYEKLISDWIETYPDKYQPYLAAAEYYYAKGWESRGNNSANETSDEQFKVMEQYFLKAEKNANNALLINPNLLVAYDILISISNTGTTEKSEDQLIQEALELFPYSFSIWATASWAKQPRWGGSYQEMEELSKKAENYYNLNSRLSILYGCIYYDQGRMEVLKENYDKAIDLLNKAQVYGDYAIFYFELASAHYYNKQYDTALKNINKSIQLKSITADNYILRAKILGRQEKYIESIDNMHIAERINPGYSYLLRSKKWLSRLFLNKGHQLLQQKSDETMEFYNFAIQLDDKNYEAFYLRGMASTTITNFKSGISDFQKAIELNPHHFESYRMIDYTLMQTRQWDTIIKHWNKFLELEPNHAEAYFERSGTYYHKNDMEHCLADLKKACELGHQEACNRYKMFSKN